MDARPSEHIFLESVEMDPAAAAQRPGAPRLRLALRNPIRRVTTELTLYEEGYIGVRERRAMHSGPEERFDLCHLDAKPVLSRRPASSALRAALYSIALAAATAGLAYFSIAPVITVPIAAAALLAAALAAVVFVYRTEEQVQFVTRHGRIAAVTLIANAGCIRACRALVPQLAATIGETASRADGDHNSRLRAEVREHYRLRASGFLSPADCMSAVQRILSRFD
jgi:hypothetical protein